LKIRYIGTVSNVWKIIFIALLTILLSGCEKKSFPAGRLQQSVGKFSFVTPDGWFRTRLPGIDFVIVSAKDDYGIKPNIFVEEIFLSSQLDHTVAMVSDKNRNTLRAYETETQSDFSTQSGLPGIKICAHHKTKQDLPLATFRYFIRDTDRVISITCTCADAVKSTYEPIFDAAMKSLESEPTLN
jgi:hypothetical protein